MAAGKSVAHVDAAVQSFWEWWARYGLAAASGILQDRSESVGEITDHVHALHPGLAWEIGGAGGAPRELTLTSGGDQGARATAERWRAAAPADSGWTFRTTIGARGVGSTINLDGRTLDPARARVDVTTFEQSYRLHVRVTHPDFVELPKEMTVRYAFLLLDSAIGEDDVTRWVGEISTDHAALRSAVTLSQFAERVASLSAARTLDQWTMASWQARFGGMVVVTVRRPISWVDRPLFTELAVLRMRRPGGKGMSDAETAEVTAIDEAIESLLDDSAIDVATETTRSARDWFIYFDPAGQTAQALTAWASTRRGLKLTFREDLGWQAVRHLTG